MEGEGGKRREERGGKRIGGKGEGGNRSSTFQTKVTQLVAEPQDSPMIIYD